MKKILCILQVTLLLAFFVACNSQDTAIDSSMGNDTSLSVSVLDGESEEPIAASLQIVPIRAGQIKNILEVGDRLVFLSLPHGAEEDDNTFDLEVYDISTGSLVYSLDRSDYPELGELMRVDKEIDVDGYDYRMIFDNTVVFRNSAEAGRDHEEVVALADSPMAITRLRGYGNLDMNNAHVVYGTEDGIWLAERGSVEAVNILPNTILFDKFPDVPDGLLANPRIMDGGKKIVAGVYRTESFDFTGAVTYDVTEQITEYTLNVIMPDYVEYPVGRNYVVGRGTQGVQRLDITSGEVEDYRMEDVNLTFASYDYEVLVVARYSEFPEDLVAYVCSVDDATDTSAPILTAADDAAMRLSGITEHFVVFRDGDTLSIVKYM